MATIKPLEGRTVHQIQSGQVIVDLCSVAKELVENSLDACATSIEVRFKNHGLDSIEVQDNGVGIAQENYETIALKHYTSKLSSYDELTSLKTFGFRGEALSSLCALSKFHILTAQADEAPKGTRLDFEISGKLKSVQVAPSPKGTTVAVENLFTNLPVRRRELEKNIKREYGKVLGVLQAYACISTNIKFSVSNVLAKGKKVMVFATRSNPTTRENIANVYGAKALASLVSMNLSFEMGSSMQGSRAQIGSEDKQVHVLGHISRPILGEGRQAPDRQMFFVNSRPCTLPQVAKVFNEVYKAYNISQSPFIFANITLDTNAYDVNVSPDKRTILLHDQNILLESLKQSLIDLFEEQDQTMPPSQRRGERLSSFKPLMISRELSKVEDADSGSPKEPSEGDQDAGAEMDVPHRVEDDAGNETAVSLIENFVGRGARERAPTTGKTTGGGKPTNAISKDKQKLVNKLGMIADRLRQVPAVGDEDVDAAITSDSMPDHVPRSIHDFNQRIASQRPPTEHALMEIDKSSTHVDQANDSRAASGVVSNAFNRMRPKRAAAEVATITIGSKTTTAILGSTPSKRRRISATPSDGSDSESSHDVSSTQAFGSSMKIFTAPGVRTPRVSKKRSNALHLAGRPEHDHGSSSPRHPSNETERLGVAAANQLRPAAGAGETSHLAEDQVFSPLESARDEAGSDSEPLDEARKKSREDAKVAKLIRQAEEKMAKPSGDSTKRTQQLLRRRGHKNSTTQLTQIVPCSIDRIVTLLQKLENLVSPENNSRVEPATLADVDSAEERLSLTVCKEDFSRMHIVGQFNLGFILAFRPSRRKANEPAAPASEDELFIIDQHASDEKFNFERLQSSTVVQNQPLVKPYTLDLTAIEEEIIIENNDILLTNGFVVSIDTSGEEPVGQRCKLLSLPMSREVTFDTADLEELIALLADSPALVGTATGDRWNSPAKSTHSSIPRPSKVRRLFAMRACRSSVMIGKSLSKAQMTKLVRHMGEIDKPWNCPHGRPTMRHVLGLGAWEGWREEMGEDDPEAWNQVKVDWKGWTKKMKMQRGERETQNGERDRHGKGSRAAGRYPAVDDETEDDDGTEDEAEDDETDSEAGDGEGNGDGDEEEAGDGDDDLEETSTAEDEGEGAEN